MYENVKFFCYIFFYSWKYQGIKNRFINELTATNSFGFQFFAIFAIKKRAARKIDSTNSD